MDIRTVGVIGAGTIGRGVAQDFAAHDYDVVLIDVTQRQLDGARRDIAHGVRTRSLFGGGGRPADPDAVLARIDTGTDLERVAQCDFVVENVTESWDAKREVYQTIDRSCPASVAFAVNTSAIPITRVASVTSRPDRIVGVHFMNPVPLMPMVEVVRGHHTSPATLELVAALLTTLDKTAVVVNDAPGFITNRILMLTINEAIFAVQDGVAAADEIDRICKGCFGNRMGPLETADLIGLDTVLNSITVLYTSYCDSKYRPSPLLRRMVDAGLLGRKSGQGFYTYPTDPRSNGDTGR